MSKLLETTSKELMSFIERLPENKKSDNVYEIICQDKDGNITDRKFGLNIYTNKGFNADIVNNNNNTGEYVNYYGISMVFGRGTGVLSADDVDLFDRITEFGEPRCTIHYISSREAAYCATCNEYINIYDANKDAIIGRRLSETVVLDYNYNGIEENINITEFGEYGRYGDSIDWTNKPMRTHCLVYDDNFDPSYFTKRINEKVTIKVYRACIIYCDTIRDLWDNEEKYLFVNPAYLVRSSGIYSSDYLPWMAFSVADQISGRCRTEDDFPMYPVPYNCITDSGCYSQDLGGGKNYGFGGDGDSRVYTHLDNGVSQTYNVTVSNGKRNNSTFAQVLMDDKYNVKCSMGLYHAQSIRNYYWYYNWHWGLKKQDYIICLEKYNLQIPEEITLDYAFTDDFLHPRFRNIFGLHQNISYVNQHAATFHMTMIPVNDFHITSVKSYNYQTDEFDIVEQFTDDPDYDFRNPERGIWGRYTATVNGTTMQYDVHINIHAGIVPLQGFNNPDSNSIYLTDSYWDPSTFVKLEHNNVVPNELKHKRYIIKQPVQDVGWAADGQVGGIFTVRESNKHALVPSQQTEEINIEHTEIPFQNHDNYSANTVFASDEGWVFCWGKLIYPESDDGTGHPYIYTLSPFTWSYVKYTHDRIVFIDGDRYRVYSQGTSPCMRVFKIDPTHPEIDPNTTKVDYLDRDIKFEMSGDTSASVYIRDWCIFTINEKTDHMIITRNTGILFIDLNNHTHNIDYLPNMTGFRNGLAKCANMIYGTTYIIVYPQIASDTENNVFTFWIYDLETQDILYTFTIPRESGMVLHGNFGFKNVIYIDIYRDNTSHWIYMYDYVNDTLLDAKQNLWWSYTIDDNWIGKMNGIRSKIDFNDECILFSGKYNENDSYSNGCRTMVIFADEPTNPYYFENAGNYASGSSWQKKSYSFTGGSLPNMPRLGYFDNNKHFVALINAGIDNNYSDGYLDTSGTGGWNIIDIGYIKNKGLHTPQQLCENIPAPLYRKPNVCSNLRGCQASNTWASQYYFDNNNKWFTEVTFYKGKVLVFTTFGKPLLMPIDTFLFHQLKGTTRTIQAWNNPKLLQPHSVGFILDKFHE